MATETVTKKWLSKHGQFIKTLGGGFALDVEPIFYLATHFGAVKQGAKEALIYTMFPSIGLALTVGAPVAGVAAGAIARHVHADRKQFEQMFTPNVGGNYIDTQQAYTMRQRAVQAIQSSHMNARSALGNTARMMHRL